jgi:hypothetical protein
MSHSHICLCGSVSIRIHCGLRPLPLRSSSHRFVPEEENKQMILGSFIVFSLARSVRAFYHIDRATTRKQKGQ